MKTWLTVLVIIILGASAWYFFSRQAAVDQPPPVATQTVVTPAPDPDTGAEPETAPQAVVVEEKRMPAAPELEPLPLPPLTESDPLAKQTLSDLFGEAETLRYFVSEDIVARAVANIDALGSRQVPQQIQVVRGPQDSFKARENPEPEAVILNEVGDPLPQFLPDPANAQRYTPYVEMLEAIDTQTLIELYRQKAPLFQEAYRELGFPDGDFSERLKEVIDELLATPEVEEPLRLIKPEAFYLFADPELEALPAGQKVMIRMGSENAARVKARLAEIREAL